LVPATHAIRDQQRALVAGVTRNDDTYGHDLLDRCVGRVTAARRCIDVHIAASPAGAPSLTPPAPRASWARNKPVGSSARLVDGYDEIVDDCCLSDSATIYFAGSTDKRRHIPFE